MSRYHLSGRTVAITGSTGGLGSAVATALRHRGANLALLDRDPAALSAQSEALGGPSLALPFTVDVQDLSSLDTAMHAAAEHFGRLDVVIANAGIDTVGPMSTLDPSAFERVIDINLTGVWRTFRAALPYVHEQRGYLMAISSMAAFVHSPLQASYTASKAGVWAMCDSIRLELRPTGVAVGSVHPTFFATPMMEQVHADPAGRALWGGNTGGLWRMIPIELVVDGIIAGIEHRSATVVVPGVNRPVAAAPGLFRRLLERIGFDDQTITTASSLAAPSAEHMPA
jgi:NAD(P)-dependent dehydrogenase (short-subunit alcohol dehydrogenase family)